MADPLAEAAAIFVLIPLTLSVAIWNRFPIIFYDTGAYLFEGLGRQFLAERSPVYSLFLSFGGAGVSLWFIALIQAAATAFVMVETARAVAPRLSLGALLATGVALVLLTGLPWYVGQIEPDCFAALVALSIYLLAFHAHMLAGWRCYVLMAVATLAMAVHPSHLLLGGGLTAALFAWRVAHCAVDGYARSPLRLTSLRSFAISPASGGGKRGLFPPPLAGEVDFAASISERRRTEGGMGARTGLSASITRPVVCCVLGLTLIVASNLVLTGQFFVSRAGPAFVFARLLQDRIVMRLLDDTCPASHYRLCAFKDELPRTADQWLWGRGSPFRRMHRFMGTSAESSRIIWDSLKRYPALQAEAALADAVRQFGTFKTGDQIEPQEWVLSRPLGEFIPNQLQAYLAARQQQGAIDFRPINRVHVPFGWISLAGLVLALVRTAWTGHREKSAFLGFILLALMANATICGALSNPHDRYQSRLIWLAPFALVLIAGDRAIFALRGWGESGT